MIAIGSVAAILLRLIVGGGQYVVNKIALDWKGDSDEWPSNDKGEKKKFQKSAFLVFVTFLSMFTVILPFFVSEYRKLRRAQVAAGQKPSHPYTARMYLLTIAPSIMEVASMAMSMFANKGLNPVIMLVLKSVRVVFTAFLMSLFPSKAGKLRNYQWVGVVITTIGIIPSMCVEYQEKQCHNKDAKTCEPADPLWSFWVPVALLVGSELIKAVRYNIEERILKANELTAEFLVFMQSFIGLFLSAGLVYFAHLSTKENFFETVSMLKLSPAIWIWIGLHFAMVGLSNYASTLITKVSGSVLNSILGQARGLFTWMFGLAAHYGLQKYGEFGKPLKANCVLDILGFVILGVGSLVYSGDLKLPWASCRAPEKVKKVVETEEPATSVV